MIPNFRKNPFREQAKRSSAIRIRTHSKACAPLYRP